MIGIRPALIVRMIGLAGCIDRACRSDSPAGRKLSADEALDLLSDGLAILADVIVPVCGPHAAHIVRAVLNGLSDEMESAT